MRKEAEKAAQENDTQLEGKEEKEGKTEKAKEKGEEKKLEIPEESKEDHSSDSSDEDKCEDPEKEGYHLTELGEKLKDRYMILRKLGQGAFS